MLDTDTMICGDCLEVMRTMPGGYYNCCVTSPPYWGLRDYGVDGQIGLEKTPEEYIAKMVAVFREVWRVLRDDGTLWLNMGDSYNAGRNGGWAGGKKSGFQQVDERYQPRSGANAPGLKPKDLCGIPWRVALALQADGWYLRQDIIWHKPNPMPESVTDRCTKAHEYIFLMTKKPRYFYDADAIREEAQYGRCATFRSARYENNNAHDNSAVDVEGHGANTPSYEGGRNKRSVWTVPTAPYKEEHFATFPPKLIEPCILAGTSGFGCCEICSMPWERVVKSGRVPTRNVVTSKTTGRGQMEFGNRDPARHVTETKTIGWRPMCSCWDDEYRKYPRSGKSKRRKGQDACDTWFSRVRKRPGKDSWPHKAAIVLDPFMGSGTVAAVAYENNRHYVGIDLNPDPQIQKRIRDVHDKYALFEMLDTAKGGD